MENIGSSATIGSWEIIAISRPRTVLSCGSDMPTSSRPCQRIEPPDTDTPSGSRPSSDRAVIVFPQPDSPTRPSTWPGRRENETPVTSCGPSSTATDRSRTSRTAVGSAGGASLDATTRRRRRGRRLSSVPLPAMASASSFAATTVIARIRPVGTMSHGAS